MNVKCPEYTISPVPQSAMMILLFAAREVLLSRALAVACRGQGRGLAWGAPQVICMPGSVITITERRSAHGTATSHPTSLYAPVSGSPNCA